MIEVKSIKSLVKSIKSLDQREMFMELMALEVVKDKIIELNHQQLRRGQDSMGTSLSSYRPYSMSYARFKGSEVVDLYVTGRFYDTFRIASTAPSTYEVQADTKLYGRDFKEIYGDDILGLSAESLIELQEFLKPLIFIYIKKHLKDGLR